MDLLKYTPEFWLENKEECCKTFADENNWNSVPLVNANELHNLKDGTLVRFTGMIQDMYNPEYYFAQYEVLNEVTKETHVKCGKYRDTTNLAENEVVHFESCKTETSERNTLVMITFPGLNEWVHNAEREQNIPVTTTTNINNPTESTTNTSQNAGRKRSVEEDDEPMETDNSTRDQEPSTSTANSQNKRKCTENKPDRTVVSRDHILNFPLGEQNGKCCHIKVYENANLFKLNEMVEVIGFLSVDPQLADPHLHDNEEDSEMEIQTHNPPPSLVPRIHCVLFNKLLFYNPLLKTISLENEQVLNLYKELSIVLTQLLFGDKLTADYLICHLISSVYLRKDIMALGKFTLNISNIPSQTVEEYGKQLNEFLQLLLPKSHYLPMSLDNMNDLAFSPKKDYECNRVTSGILQLSDNTHLILDETKLQPGQLNDSGCKGLSALASTIKNQKVSYDFNYYQMEFDCDIPILIISEGTSLLPSDYHVPLKPEKQCVNTFSEIVDAAKHFLKPELLNHLRVYLTKMRHESYSLSDQVLELVQDEFVQLRRNDNKISADDLHQLLVLARLICLAQGKQTLDEVCWRQACNMEAERKARVAALPKRK